MARFVDEATAELESTIWVVQGKIFLPINTNPCTRSPEAGLEALNANNGK
jgi:hypothetical protein